MTPKIKKIHVGYDDINYSFKLGNKTFIEKDLGSAKSLRKALKVKGYY